LNQKIAKLSHCGGQGRKEIQMIKLHNIHKYYASGEQRLHVLKGIDLHISIPMMKAITFSQDEKFTS
jgi:hypothetical protein